MAEKGAYADTLQRNAENAPPAYSEASGPLTVVLGDKTHQLQPPESPIVHFGSQYVFPKTTGFTLTERARLLHDNEGEIKDEDGNTLYTYKIKAGSWTWRTTICDRQGKTIATSRATKGASWTSRRFVMDPEMENTRMQVNYPRMFEFETSLLEKPVPYDKARDAFLEAEKKGNSPVLLVLLKGFWGCRQAITDASGRLLAVVKESIGFTTSTYDVIICTNVDTLLVLTTIMMVHQICEEEEAGGSNPTPSAPSS
eukprot:comp12118_c0_seq1/m.6854 comp12118_c0_seq1/g.6854  ORF comp12118_c0_seq1/g.6854 comp12118_c0_seq1/m.6854 type:complete len:255 (-) comp12118_c0_seq1:859-1623(-)